MGLYSGGGLVFLVFKEGHLSLVSKERRILIALRLFLKFLNRNSSILLFMLRYTHRSIQFWMQIPVIYFFVVICFEVKEFLT